MPTNNLAAAFAAPLERPAPGRAPSAFKIWPAGEVPTDHGTFIFSERSAQLLMAEQEAKGLPYPFDIDHLSRELSAPQHARQAVGWHRIEVRSGELWAVACEWQPEIRKALEQDPPGWRFYSPVFTYDPETREILRYLGCSLTNLPATHDATDLAIAASALSSPQLKTLVHEIDRHLLARGVPIEERQRICVNAALIATGHAPAAAATNVIPGQTPSANRELNIAMGLEQAAREVFVHGAELVLGGDPRAAVAENRRREQELRNATAAPGTNVVDTGAVQILGAPQAAKGSN